MIHCTVLPYNVQDVNNMLACKSYLSSMKHACKLHMMVKLQPTDVWSIKLGLSTCSQSQHDEHDAGSHVYHSSPAWTLKGRHELLERERSPGPVYNTADGYSYLEKVSMKTNLSDDLTELMRLLLRQAAPPDDHDCSALPAACEMHHHIGLHAAVHHVCTSSIKCIHFKQFATNNVAQCTRNLLTRMSSM